jgi:hypothetical protein
MNCVITTTELRIRAELQRQQNSLFKAELHLPCTFVADYSNCGIIRLDWRRT